MRRCSRRAGAGTRRSALAVPRSRGGRKVAPQLQRMLADDLMAAVFPDAAACLENIPGDREIPDHPLVKQTVRDCLQEAMDFDGLRAVLARSTRRAAPRRARHAGTVALRARDPQCAAVRLPRRCAARGAAHAGRAVAAGGRAAAAGDLGALDPAAIATGPRRGTARPAGRGRDCTMRCCRRVPHGRPRSTQALEPHLEQLIATRRAGRVWFDGHARNSGPDRRVGGRRTSAGDPSRARRRRRRAGARRRRRREARAWTCSDALAELVRDRHDDLGPVTSQRAGRLVRVPVTDIDAALLALETEGVVLRGRFSAAARGRCARVVAIGALLARIHRYTLNRLRAEIEPVSAPTSCASCSAGSTSSLRRQARRPRRPAGDRGDAGRLRARGGSVGAKRARRASRRLRPVAARHAVPGGRSRLGAAVSAAGRRRTRPEPPRLSGATPSRCSCGSTARCG